MTSVVGVVQLQVGMLANLGEQRLSRRLLQVFAKYIMHSERGTQLISKEVRFSPATPVCVLYTPAHLLCAVPADDEVLEDDCREEVEGDDDGYEPPDEKVQLRPRRIGELGIRLEEDMPVVDDHQVPQHDQRRREVIKVVRPVPQLLERAAPEAVHVLSPEGNATIIDE